MEEQNRTTETETTEENNSIASDEVFVVSRSLLNYFVVGATFLVVGVAIGLLWASNQSTNNEELINQAVGTAAADVSRQIGEDVVAAMESLDGGAQELDLNQRYDVVAGDDPVLGVENAVITMVEFSDFRCGYCGRFALEILPTLLENYGDELNFVYRNYIMFGQPSYDAALAASCAHDQGEFWSYHNLLFEIDDEFSRDVFISLAEQLELNTEIFTDCYDNDTHRDGIFADLEEGRSLYITGTPTFFINGRPIIGAQPYVNFVQVIEEELAAAAEGDSGGEDGTS